MARTVLVTLAIFFLPLVVYVVAGLLMLEVSGRIRIPKNKVEGTLAQSWLGYDEAKARDFWDKLGEDGRRAELKLLQIDLLFPLLLFAAIALSTVLQWTMLDRPFSILAILAPLLIFLLADWTENSIHLNQLPLMIADVNAPLDASKIRLASYATIAKLWSASLSVLILLAMTIAVVVRTIRSGPTE